MGIATRLRAVQSTVQIQVGTRRPDRLQDPTSLLFNGYRAFFTVCKVTRVTMHNYLVPKLRIGGAIFLILLYFFMAWTG
jgi:hypothetical protein